ncbi:SPOR domain-containing protein [Kushneria sp. EE4]
MKYGMRERISGIVIIVALALILLPIMFGGSSDDEESADDSSMIIEQPINMSQRDVAAPQSPLPENEDRVDDSARSGQSSQSNQLFPDRQRETEQAPARAEPSSPQTGSRDADTARTGGNTASSSGSTAASSAGSTSSTGSASNSGSSAASSSSSRPATTTRESSSSAQRQTPARSDDSSGDPIMAAANRNSASASQPSGSGGWAVQAGSFGQPENADRLIEQLKSQGFAAYKQPRGELNTVYVGPYGSTEESERARAELQSRANIKGLIVRREGGQ